MGWNLYEEVQPWKLMKTTFSKTFQAYLNEAKFPQAVVRELW